MELLNRPRLLCYMLTYVGSRNLKLQQTRSADAESIIPEGGRLGCCSRLAEQAGWGGSVGALLALLPLLRKLVQPLQVLVRSHRIPLQTPHVLAPHIYQICYLLSRCTTTAWHAKSAARCSKLLL